MFLSNLCIDIDDLSEVLDSISTLKKWKPLGSELGLSRDTIDGIEQSSEGNLYDCKVKMVKAWLKQQDSVKMKGGPTWEQLARYLKAIGERVMGEDIEYTKKIDTSQSTITYQESY